eukprot:14408871-Heterocapsa_arctica.AAC.1
MDDPGVRKDEKIEYTHREKEVAAAWPMTGCGPQASRGLLQPTSREAGGCLVRAAGLRLGFGEERWRASCGLRGEVRRGDCEPWTARREEANGSRTRRGAA